MRIIAGEWRGRRLTAPLGEATRPTADRVRQALFDILLHASWGGRDILENAQILDAYAGTGALGLEALSRGAAHATFFENSPNALVTLRANIATCGAGPRSTIIPADILRPHPGRPHAIIFLDPPYGQDLVQRSLNVLRAQGWLMPDSLVIAETGRLDSVVEPARLLAQRVHGAACLSFWRE